MATAKCIDRRTIANIDEGLRRIIATAKKDQAFAGRAKLYAGVLLDDIASSKQKDKDVLLLEPGILRRIGSALGVIGVELVKFDTKSGERLTELGDTISDWVAKTGYETSVEVPLDQFRDLAGNFTEAAKMFDVKVTLTTKK